MEDPNTEGVALLILSDGTVLTGQPFGKKGTVFGEINFNTSMTGYQEMLTDPSSVSQLLSAPIHILEIMDANLILRLIVVGSLALSAGILAITFLVIRAICL